MDFRQLFQSGENDVNNADIMFMQYSNYFGLNAVGKGLDPNNEGVTIAGCNLIATHNTTDDTITASITDGYVVIEGKQTKCESTSSIQFACAYFNGLRRSAYIFAEVSPSYNPLGNKLYGDGVQRDSWLENRVSISYSFSSSPQAGKVLIGSCYVGGLSTDPEPIVVTQIVPSIASAVSRNVGNNDIVTTHRGGRPNELVSVSNLYNVMANYTMIKLSSSIKTIDLFNNVVFQFSLPANTIDAFMISSHAKETGETNNVYYGNRPTVGGTFTPEGQSWYVNLDTQLLYVAYDTTVGNFATALVMVDRAA